MKILYVTERMPFGRGESFIIPEVTQLLEDGHEIRIIPFGMADVFHHHSAQSLLERTEVISLLSPAVLVAIAWDIMRSPIRMARAAWILRKSSSAKQLLLNGVALLKGIYAARVTRRWNADHLHAHWVNYTSTLAMTVGILTDIPWSFTGHRYDIVADNLLTEKLRRAAFARFISKSSLALAAARANGVALERSHVIHMGVRTPECVELRASPNTPVFLCPAALVPVKGHRFLVEAMTILHQRGIACEMLLIGDGPLRDEIDRQIRAAGISEKIKLLGQLPHQEVLNFYVATGVTGVVLPSVNLGNGLHEGIPVALLEAMSFSVPVIATCTGGIPELLDDGAGLLVQPQDAVSLADAMQRLISDPKLQRSLGQRGRRRVEEDFNIRTQAAQLVSMFGTGSRLSTSYRGSAAE